MTSSVYRILKNLNNFNTELYLKIRWYLCILAHKIPSNYAHNFQSLGKQESLLWANNCFEKKVIHQHLQWAQVYFSKPCSSSVYWERMTCVYRQGCNGQFWRNTSQQCKPAATNLSSGFDVDSSDFWEQSELGEQWGFGSAHYWESMRAVAGLTGSSSRTPRFSPCMRKMSSHSSYSWEDEGCQRGEFLLFTLLKHWE